MKNIDNNQKLTQYNHLFVDCEELSYQGKIDYLLKQHGIDINTEQEIKDLQDGYDHLQETLEINKDKVWTDKDMLNAFNAGQLNKRSKTVSFGMMGSATETTFREKPEKWLEKYKKE